MKDYADALLADLVDGRQDVGGLTHAQRGGRLVENQHLGPEVDGPGNGNGLPFTAGECAHGLIRLAQTDPHLRHLLHGHPVRGLEVDELERAELFLRLPAHPEVPGHRHQRDHRQILVDRGDTGLDGVAGAAEFDLGPAHQDLPLGRRVDAGHGFDEGRLARAVIPQEAMALAGMNRKGDTGQGDDGPEVLFDIAKFDQGRGHVSVPP